MKKKIQMNNQNLHNTNYKPNTQVNNNRLNPYIPNKRGGFKGRDLDTLGKFGTENYKLPFEFVAGNGIDANNSESLYRWAKKKFVTINIILPLIDIAKERKNDRLKQALWNTYHCCNELKLVNGRLHGKYCKNRFCSICNGIRKAELINKYLPVIQKWEDPHYMHLTARSCKKEKLSLMINKVLKGFNRIRAKYKKRHQRGNGPLLIGIKALECNYNPQDKTYNPHIHLLVPNEEIAKNFKKEWLTLWTSDFTSPAGQGIRKVKNREEDLIEVIKYATTIFTEKNKNKKRGSRKKGKHGIYIKAMYNIICAMQNKHTIEAFGFTLPKQKKAESLVLKPVISPVEFTYYPKIRDWVNDETGEILTGYQPTIQLLSLIQNEMDVKLE